jgi:hypothetical protein
MPENRIMTKHRAMPENKKIFLISLIVIKFIQDRGKNSIRTYPLFFLRGTLKLDIKVKTGDKKPNCGSPHIAG